MSDLIEEYIYNPNNRKVDWTSKIDLTRTNIIPIDMELTLNEYQQKAMTTCMESCDNFSYMFIGLVGEVGEIASKVAKLIRKDKARILNNDLQKWPNQTSISDEDNEALLAEAGDCLWMLAGLCNTMGWKLENVAQYNLDKLASRKERGVIDGSGDRR